MVKENTAKSNKTMTSAAKGVEDADITGRVTLEGIGDMETEGADDGETEGTMVAVALERDEGTEAGEGEGVTVGEGVVEEISEEGVVEILTVGCAEGGGVGFRMLVTVIDFQYA